MKNLNKRLDVDTIANSLTAVAAATIEGDGRWEFFPAGTIVANRFVGYCRKPVIARKDDPEHHIRKGDDTGMRIRVNAATFFKPLEWQAEHARALCRKLNYDYDHDGAWAVCWTLPNENGVPTELKIAYQDKDGDVQFVVESGDRQLSDLVLHGPEGHIGNCLEAFKQWQETILTVIDRKDSQTFQMARGQQQRDPLDQAPLH